VSRFALTHLNGLSAACYCPGTEFDGPVSEESVHARFAAKVFLSKREIAKKACSGFCRCEEPVKYMSEIQARYDDYVKNVPMR